MLAPQLGGVLMVEAWVSQIVYKDYELVRIGYLPNKYILGWSAIFLNAASWNKT